MPRTPRSKGQGHIYTQELLFLLFSWFGLRVWGGEVETWEVEEDQELKTIPCYTVSLVLAWATVYGASKKKKKVKIRIKIKNFRKERKKEQWLKKLALLLRALVALLKDPGSVPSTMII